MWTRFIKSVRACQARVVLWATAGVAVALLGGCASAPQPDFARTDIDSIVVMPPINESTQVGADQLVYYASALPIAEHGYYVQSLDTVKYVLEGEGLYEPEQAYRAGPTTICKLFDSDAVLFIRITDMDAKYKLVNTTTALDATYELYDRQGQLVWTTKTHSEYDSSTGGGGILGVVVDVVQAATARAVVNFWPVASVATGQAVQNWPVGPHLITPEAKAQLEAIIRNDLNKPSPNLIEE